MFLYFALSPHKVQLITYLLDLAHTGVKTSFMRFESPVKIKSSTRIKMIPSSFFLGTDTQH